MRKFIYYLGMFSGVVLLAILALMSGEVIFRYFFNKPILGTVEISAYLLVIFGFTGMAWTQSQKGHILIELVTEKLSERTNCILRIISLILSLAVFVLITWQTSIAFWKSFKMMEVRWGALPLPVWPVKAMVAFGSLILCVQFVIDIYDELKGKGLGVKQDIHQQVV
jgi:TRAP-type C4-dicarboxylate transport system permease small subunit